MWQAYDIAVRKSWTKRTGLGQTDFNIVKAARKMDSNLLENCVNLSAGSSAAAPAAAPLAPPLLQLALPDRVPPPPAAPVRPKAPAAPKPQPKFGRNGHARGSCYSCGSTEHYSDACPEKPAAAPPAAGGGKRPWTRAMETGEGHKHWDKKRPR